MKVKLSNQAEEIAEQLRLDRSQLVGLIQDILDIASETGRELSGNIVCGLDVNGPIVDCDDSELNAYPGSSEAINYLTACAGFRIRG
jgi:hypothetical protein